MFNKFYTLLFICVIVFLGCDSPIENGIGPCVHTYKEPILMIESASSSFNNTPIESLTIKNILIDSVAINLDILTSESSKNVVISDSTLTCTLPCGFGTEPGSYSFDVAANGYKDVAISSKAEYQTSGGNCPSYSTDGQKLDVVLPKN